MSDVVSGLLDAGCRDTVAVVLEGGARGLWGRGRGGGEWAGEHGGVTSPNRVHW